MAIVYVGELAAYASSANSSSHTITVPAGAAVGDVLILQLFISGGPGTILTVSDGFNTWFRDLESSGMGSTGTGGYGSVWSCKVATALPAGATISITLTASRSLCALLEAFTGLDISGAHTWYRTGAQTATNANGTSFDSGPASGVTSTDLLITLLGVTATPGTITIAQPSSPTAFPGNPQTSSGTVRSLDGWYQLAAGSDDEFSGTYTSSRTNVAMVMAYIAASSGPIIVNGTGESDAASGVPQALGITGVIAAESDAASGTPQASAITGSNGESDSSSEAFTTADVTVVWDAEADSVSAASAIRGRVIVQGGIAASASGASALRSATLVWSAIANAVSSASAITGQVAQGESHAVSGASASDTIILHIGGSSNAVTGATGIPSVGGLIFGSGVCHATSDALEPTPLIMDTGLASAHSHAHGVANPINAGTWNPQRRT